MFSDMNSDYNGKYSCELVLINNQKFMSNNTIDIDVSGIYLALNPRLPEEA